jgi:hypothetical protein
MTRLAYGVARHPDEDDNPPVTPAGFVDHHYCFRGLLGDRSRASSLRGHDLPVHCRAVNVP